MVINDVNLSEKGTYRHFQAKINLKLFREESCSKVYSGSRQSSLPFFKSPEFSKYTGKILWNLHGHFCYFLVRVYDTFDASLFVSLLRFLL